MEAFNIRASLCGRMYAKAVSVLCVRHASAGGVANSLPYFLIPTKLWLLLPRRKGRVDPRYSWTLGSAIDKVRWPETELIIAIYVLVIPPCNQLFYSLPLASDQRASGSGSLGRRRRCLRGLQGLASLVSRLRGLALKVLFVAYGRQLF